MIDRYIASVALQLWQRFFQLALQKGVVSNHEDTWKAHRESALEYLARGKLMAICSLFFDGPVLHEDGDIDLYQAAQRGVGIALGLGDSDLVVAGKAERELGELVAELEQAERNLEKLLADRCAYIAQQGPEAIALELARCPELIPQHRAWLGSPIAAARGAVVAAELERPPEAMPPTSSAPAEANQGFNPAFFKQPKEPRGPNSRQPSPRAVPRAPAPSSPDEPAPAAELEPEPSSFNQNMTLFQPGKPQ